MSELPMLPPIPVEVAEVCRQWFGAYRSGRWSPPNRCDSCPLRAPCMAWGIAPAHTQQQIAEARAVFVSASQKLLGGVA